ALRHAHVQGLSRHADAHAAAVVDRVQRHRQLGPRIAHRLPAARTAIAAGTAAKQLLEEVGEAAARSAAGEDLVDIEIRLPAGPAPEAARRRTDLVAGPIAARAQLVIGLALGRVTQRLVGLVDRLELFLGALFLADVRVVLARQ